MYIIYIYIYIYIYTYILHIRVYLPHILSGNLLHSGNTQLNNVR